MKLFSALSIVLLAGTSLAAASNQNRDLPDYSNRSNIYDTSVATPIPHAVFLSSGKEYKVPYTLDQETVKVGKDLRKAWQRLEDRYYWRAMTSLNNPAMLLTHCTVNWGQGLKTEAPKVITNTNSSMYPSQLKGVIPDQAPQDRLQMDGFNLFPGVPNTDYCTGLQPDFQPMYLPGICVGTVSEASCIQGKTATLNPAAPRPIWFNRSEALRRIESARAQATGPYQVDYQKDVLKAISPSPTFFPMIWNKPVGGAIVAPTMSATPNPQAMTQSAQEAGERLSSRFGTAFRGTAPVYYAQGLTGSAVTEPLKAHLLPGRTDVLDNPNPPGVWQLEEYKRRWPVNPVPMYERFGYTNLFQVWSEPVTKLLPEPAQQKPLRQMIYMATGTVFYPPSPFPVVVPAPLPIQEYSAGLPYAGLQTRFTWVSVPEAYSVPRVSGQPANNYNGVIK